MPGFGKDQRGIVNYESKTQALSTLATKDVILLENASNIAQDFRMTLCKYWMCVRSLTAGDGPVLVGMASGELSAQEIEDCIEDFMTDRGDLGSGNNTHLPVWPLEWFINLSNDAHHITKGEFSPRWTFSEDSGWIWWAYNFGTGSLTTGAIVDVFTKVFGVWV